MDMAQSLGYTQKELDTFKSVCNQLLSRTFVTRTVYNAEKGRVPNEDYGFLSAHFDDVRQYLALLDWDVRRDDQDGYIYVLNTDEANRISFNKAQTALLLALRLIYDEMSDSLGLDRDVLCTVRDVLEKLVTDYAILPAKPNMDDLRRTMTLLEHHRIIQRIDGRFKETGCRFAILPTILTAVSDEKLADAAATLRKEEDAFEEAEEDPAD